MALGLMVSLAGVVAVYVAAFPARPVTTETPKAPEKNAPDQKKVAADDAASTTNANLNDADEPLLTGSTVKVLPPLPDRPLTTQEIINRVGDGVELITVLDRNNQEISLGSGFVVDGAGLVATNFHVLADATNAYAQFQNGRKVGIAGYRVCDPKGDLAIVELEPMNIGLDNKVFEFTVLPLSKEYHPPQGSPVIALGHPKGFRFTATQGIVSAVRRTSELPGELPERIQSDDDFLWIQTDAAIFHGNSGGPLINQRAEVIGINTWIAEDAKQGFAAHALGIIALLDRMDPTATPLAEKNAEIKLERGKEQLADFSRKLHLARREIEELEWLPKTRRDYWRLQNFAFGCWIAAKNQFDDSLNELVESLSATKWEPSKQVATNNQFAVDNLNPGSAVLLFAKMKQVHRQKTKWMVMEIFGRGHQITVENCRGAGEMIFPGEDCMILGVVTRVTREQQSLIPHVEAGVMVKVNLGETTDEDKLRQAYDLVDLGQLDQEFPNLVRSVGSRFSELAPTSGGWRSVILNKSGKRLDAIRVRTPAGKPTDMIWAMVVPQNLEESGVIPPQGLLAGAGKPLKLTPAPHMNVQSVAHLQLVPSQFLEPNTEYIIWFTWNGSLAVEMRLALMFVPPGSVKYDTNVLADALRLKEKPAPTK